VTKNDIGTFYNIKLCEINGDIEMGQIAGTLAGIVTAFAIVFIILTFGLIIPNDVIRSSIVTDFLSRTDLELKLTIVGTVLYPSSLGGITLGTYVGYGADGATVLMALAWGTGGLVAGLVSREVAQGVLAAIFSVVLGAILVWLLVFFVVTTDYSAIIGGESILILQVVLEGAFYPAIAVVIGGLLGSGISRER